MSDCTVVKVSWDNIVMIVTRLQDGQHSVCILLGAEDSLFPTIIQSGCYSPPHLFNGYRRCGGGGTVAGV